MFCSSVAITFHQHSEYLNPSNDMLYNYSLFCQFPVSSLVFSSEWFFLAAFFRHLAVAMHLLHSLVTTVHFDLCLFVQLQLTFLQHFKVMGFTLVMSSAEDPPGSFGHHQLDFQCVPLFLARIVLLLLFLGRSIGISVASMIKTLTSWRLPVNCCFPGSCSSFIFISTPSIRLMVLHTADSLIPYVAAIWN